MNVGESSNRRQRTHSEIITGTKSMRKSSQQFASIENLESLLTCPIHLGIIDEPRQLQCGHAFCLSCLENYMNHSSESDSNQICCPICRVNTRLDHRGIKQLVPSYLHKQLTEYLLAKKEKVLNNSLQFEELNPMGDSDIFQKNTQLIKELLKDSETFSLSNASSESHKFLCKLQSIFNDQDFQRSNNTVRVRSKSVMIPSKKENIEDVFNFKFQSLDQNTIRKNMRKYREYILENHFCLPAENQVVDIAWMDYSNSYESVSDGMKLIYIVEDSSLIYLSNSEGLKIHSFSIEVDNIKFIPLFVKFHLRTIFVTGKINLRNEQSCLIQLSLSGHKERLSKKYLGILGGFCFDLTTESVFVAYPSKNQVLLIDQTLERELKVFDFGDLSPMFVTLSSKTQEIWVSCPKNNRIAVFDIATNNYLHLATNQIYDSTPTHIIETDDHRLLFLDIERSRLFWIFRWNNCLYIQLLLVMGAVENLKISTIESITDNMILFSDDKKIYLAKPNLSPKDEHQKMKCSIL